MKILPISNYQMQNQNRKQDVAFGTTFTPYLEEFIQRNLSKFSLEDLRNMELLRKDGNPRQLVLNGYTAFVPFCLRLYNPQSIPLSHGPHIDSSFVKEEMPTQVFIGILKRIFQPGKLDRIEKGFFFKALRELRTDDRSAARRRDLAQKAIQQYAGWVNVDERILSQRYINY